MEFSVIKKFDDSKHIGWDILAEDEIFATIFSDNDCGYWYWSSRVLNSTKEIVCGRRDEDDLNLEKVLYYLGNKLRDRARLTNSLAKFTEQWLNS